MFVKFQNLPNHSRIWIYQSDRKFNTQEVEFIFGPLKDGFDTFLGLDEAN